MEVRKIINICKKKKHITLFNAENVQWISDGFAAYPLWRLPKFDERSIRATYDLPDAMNVHIRNDMPMNYDFSDVVLGENQVFYEKIQLPIGGEGKVASLFTQAGVTFIDPKYLDPIEDNGDISLYERINETGELYVAVKRGMLVEAIIMPIKKVIPKGYIDDLKELTKRLIETYNAENGEEVGTGANLQ